MKKIASLLLTALLTISLFTGCGDNADPGSASSGGTAGKIAFFATSMYGIFMYSDIRNAAAPIIGGIICPPVEAAASTAPANSGL